MSFIELQGIDSVQEKKALPEGNAYTLRIIDAGLNKNDESGKTSIRTILEVDGEPEAKNIFHYLGLPAQDDDEQKRQTKLLMLKRFCHAFSIPIEDGGINVEGMVGSMCENARLVQEEYKGIMSNKFNPPPIPGSDD